MAFALAAAAAVAAAVAAAAAAAAAAVRTASDGAVASVSCTHFFSSVVVFEKSAVRY